MSTKILGNAQYSAKRIGGVTYLTAVGVAPGLNVKTDFEQLPFFIWPPIYGFYFITPDIVLPALHPFTYEEAIAFPADAPSITIQDANGEHIIDIEDINVPQIHPLAVDANEPGYCVFAITGTNILKIAQCDAILPAIYSHTFGPATYGECEKYIADNGG